MTAASGGESAGWAGSGRTTWQAIVQSFRQPYPVPWQLPTLLLIVPLYIFIPDLAGLRVGHVPELPFERSIPLLPGWALAYGCGYLFLIVLPVVVVRDPQSVRRMFSAYLFAWITAETCFVVYPTIGPRPALVVGEGFLVAGLRFLYDADAPWNCLPSLHVAHSFVSAFAVSRVHRQVGRVAVLCAAMVALSTLFTRQHYVLDVVTGVALALLARWIFLRGGGEVPEAERRVAPPLAGAVAVMAAIALAVAWAVYELWGKQT